jgi:ABC-type lipoprotein export system ATPase subunit
MNPMLEFRSVERRYKDGDNLVYALRDTSFSIEAGEFVAVMGASGSGKSTLLNLAGGLDVPTAGHVLVNGHDLSSLSVSELADLRRKEVGFVFQRLNLVPSLSVVENVMLPLELDGTSAHSVKPASPSSSTASPTTSPVVNNNVSQSPAPSSVIANSSSPTNRPAHSIRSPAKVCSRCSQNR